MPMTAALIDDLRAAFGWEAIDAVIRKGMAGQSGWFHACEAGHQVGTPFEPVSGIAVANMQIESATPEMHGSGALSRRRSR